MRKPPRRGPGLGREADSIGVLIKNSSNFTVGRREDDDDRGDQAPEPPCKQQRYRMRTFTGRVLEGQLIVPGAIAGDLLFDLALIQRGEETSIVTAALDGNTVLFDDEDFETVNGAKATVSYLTAI